MRPAIFSIAAVLALALVPSAAAKRLHSGTFCGGAKTCRTLPVATFSNQIFAGRATTRPSDAVRYYRGRLRYEPTGYIEVIFVPSRGLMKWVTPTGGVWRTVPSYPLGRLRASLAGVRPLGPSRLR